MQAEDNKRIDRLEILIEQHQAVLDRHEALFDRLVTAQEQQTRLSTELVRLVVSIDDRLRRIEEALRERGTDGRQP